jgi:hypothetical protein
MRSRQALKWPLHDAGDDTKRLSNLAKSRIGQPQ